MERTGRRIRQQNNRAIPYAPFGTGVPEQRNPLEDRTQKKSMRKGGLKAILKGGLGLVILIIKQANFCSKTAF